MPVAYSIIMASISKPLCCRVHHEHFSSLASSIFPFVVMENKSLFSICCCPPRFKTGFKIFWLIRGSTEMGGIIEAKDNLLRFFFLFSFFMFIWFVFLWLVRKHNSQKQTQYLPSLVEISYPIKHTHP